MTPPKTGTNRARSNTVTDPVHAFVTAGLFAGIGGLELGLARAGHRVVALCEQDLAARDVLDRRFPGVAMYDDVCKLRSLPREVELIAAGFPCQDLSQVGAKAGIRGRHSGLIEELFRLLRQRRVPWLVLENVPFMLHLNRGRAMRVLLAELESRGYRWAYRVVDTRAFGLPQRRLRVFIVACLDGDPRNVLLADDRGSFQSKVNGSPAAVGFYWTEGNRGLGWAENAVPTLKGGTRGHGPAPPAVLLKDGSIVIPDIRDAERLQGFPINWTLVAEPRYGRSHRWRLVGNAVTVPVARWLGNRLASPAAYDDGNDQPMDGRAWPGAAWNVGAGRYVSTASPWPVKMKFQHLADFLKFPGTPLSERATSGFLERIRASSLHLPAGFESRVADHLRRMRYFT